MTIAFFCDRCDKKMTRESLDRFYIRGPNTEPEDQLDLCIGCLSAVRDFMSEDNLVEADLDKDKDKETDRGLRHNRKVYRK